MLLQGSLFDVPPPVRGDPGVASVPSLRGAVRHQLARGAWIELVPGWLAGAGDLLAHLLETVDWQAERRQMYDRVVAVPRLLRFYGEHDRLPHPDLDAARSVLDGHYAAELGEPFRTAGLCLYRDGADSVAWHGDTVGRGASTDTMVAIVSLGSPREFLLRPRGGGAVARAIAGQVATMSASKGSASKGSASKGSASKAPASKVAPLAGPPPPDSARSGGGAAARSRRGTATIRHTLQHGDLIVMGGSCQRTWEHAVPKTARSVGPRISIQFRPRGVR